MSGIGAILGGLGGFGTGLAQGREQAQEQQYRAILMQYARLQEADRLRQQQQQEQAQAGAYRALQNYQPSQPVIPFQPQMPQGGLPGSQTAPPAGGVSPGALAAARAALSSGYPPASAAGIAGGLVPESGNNLNPAAFNAGGGGQGALGEAQWRGPRQQALLQQPNPMSRDTQNMFLLSEMQPGGPEAKTGAALRQPGLTPAAAADTFAGGNLRPGGAALAATAQLRRQAAQEVYAALGGDQAMAQAQPVVQSLEQQLPPQMRGTMDREALAHAIEQAMPDAPDNVKMMALSGAAQFLAPQEKSDLQMQMLELRNELQTVQRNVITPYQAARLKQGEAAGWDVIADKQGNLQRFNRYTGEVEPAPLAPGSTKMGTTPQARSAPAMYMKQYVEENPHATAADMVTAAGEYRRIQSLDNAYAGGQFGRQMVSLNTVADHIGRVKEYAEALRNGQIPRANQIANVIAKEMGKPEVTNFEAGRDIMADETVRLLTSTGGTEADRQGMQSRLSASMSPPQLAGVLDAFVGFTRGRYDALKQQYAQGDQKRADYFEKNIMTPEAREVYEGSASPAGGGQPQSGEPADNAIPLPKEYLQDPDGTTYSGGKYIKRGNVAVPNAGSNPTNP